jgi:ubiquinone biosynthesis protein
MDLTESPFKHAKRYRQVLSILLKYGFADFVSHTYFSKLVPHNEKWVPTREGKSVFDFSRFERLRLAFEELGTSYIKFGQIASNRPDLLPQELIDEFEKFQDHVAPIDAELIKATLQANYKQPLEELFAEINYTPLASASMAQVHRATLITGEQVVLKVQRPDIIDNIEADIYILNNLAGFVEKHFPESKSFQPVGLVRMFERSIMKELNFRSEAANIQRFQRNFAGNEFIYVPTVYPKLCTKHVLCMEYIDGFKVTNLTLLAKYGIERSQLALDGINLYFEQVFDHGFFHADPHPGNFFVLPNKKVCFIDFGMMGTIIEKDKILLGDMMLALARRDSKTLIKVLQEFAGGEIQNLNDLEYDIMDFFEEYPDKSLDEIEPTEVMDGLNRMFFTYKIKVPQNLLLLLKALVMIEGVGLFLDPKYNIIKNMEPYVERLIARKYEPKKLLRNVYETYMDFAETFRALPKDMREVMQKFKAGKVHFDVESPSIDRFNRDFNTVANRIAFAIVVAAMILGSALIIHADIPPHCYNVPVLGVAAFVIAAFFAIRLLLAISKHGKL